MKRIRLGLVLMALLVPGIAKAQVGVYAAFSEAKPGGAGTDWIQGATFGAYYDKVHLPVVNFGVDLRGLIVGSGGINQVKSGMIGPRAMVHLPIIPVRPYVEALVGAGQIQYGQGPTFSDATHLGYGAATGVDFTFFPRLDWRVVDFQYDGFRDSKSVKAISTGLVFRLPIP